MFLSKIPEEISLCDTSGILLSTDIPSHYGEYLRRRSDLDLDTSRIYCRLIRERCVCRVVNRLRQLVELLSLIISGEFRLSGIGVVREFIDIKFHASVAENARCDRIYERTVVALAVFRFDDRLVGIQI